MYEHETVCSEIRGTVSGEYELKPQKVAYQQIKNEGHLFSEHVEFCLKQQDTTPDLFRAIIRICSKFRRLFMRYTMNRPESPDKIITVNPDDLPVRKTILQYIHGGSIP